MKSLKDIKTGFKVGNTLMVIEVPTDIKYYFDLSHLMITRSIYGNEALPFFYDNEDSFYSAVKRHLKKQA